MIIRNLDFIVNLKFIKNKIVSFKIDRAVKILFCLTIITSVIFFIIGLRLYIINKNKDIKKVDQGITYMLPSGMLLICVPFIYIDYKFKFGIGLTILQMIISLLKVISYIK